MCVCVCVCVCPVTPWRWDGIVLHRKLGLTSAVTSSRFYFVLLFLCSLPALITGEPVSGRVAEGLCAVQAVWREPPPRGA